MKIPQNKTETNKATSVEENVYKYQYGKFIKIGTLKTKENDTKTKRKS